MIIRILGAESLGVRSLCCSVELKDRKVVIDPGIALGWSRYGYLPHPFQIAIGAGIRAAILRELSTATDVVISHFDGDHIPLLDPNPYQLGIDEAHDDLSRCRLWAKGPGRSPPTQQRRRKHIEEALGTDLRGAEGVREGPMAFSAPVPHGRQDADDHTVMMTRIEEDGLTFVHASDLQLLDPVAIERISQWKPTIVLVSGPPLYRHTSSSLDALKQRARENALDLLRGVDTLVIDHHLLRSEEGTTWLEELRHATGKRVLCAADFMNRARLFLEGWRQKLYSWLPVSEHWHERYEAGTVDFGSYRRNGWEVLIEKGMVKPCKWYYACPIREYTDRGKLENYWVDNYCLVGNRDCVRYRMEERGAYHPDNMLPDGTIKKEL
jgi:predicted metallo-beta-lactamase superfamily hydrolase